MAKRKLTKEDKLKGLEEFLNRASKRLILSKTKWESIMSKHLSDLHYKFKFQVPIIYSPNRKTPKGYILDFLLTDYNIVIEIDGLSTHSSKTQQKSDRQRTKNLQKLGYHVLRFWNKQVSTLSKENIDQIIKLKIQETSVNKP